MSHLFRYPTAASPSSTVTLHPALVLIQRENIRPIQRLLRAPDGTHWFFQLTPNRLQRYEVTVTDLPLANFTSFSGYQALKDFFDGITNWMERSFDMTHTDGLTLPVRLDLETWTFPEGIKDRYSGSFVLERIVA